MSAKSNDFSSSLHSTTTTTTAATTTMDLAQKKFQEGYILFYFNLFKKIFFFDKI